MKIDTSRTIVIHHDQIEAAVVSYLEAIGEIKEDEDLFVVDLGLEVDENGLVSVDIISEHQTRPELKVIR